MIVWAFWTFLLLAPVEVAGVASKYVFYGPDNKLNYKATNGNVIPDFSNVGYHQGQTLPTISSIPVKATVTAPSGDASAAIQAAVNNVGKLPLVSGYRGAVLLKAGTYKCSKTIIIKDEGVVLRGEGTSTLVQLTGKTQRAGFQLGATTSSISSKGYSTTPVVGSVKVGAKSFKVQSTSNLAVGNMILVTVKLNQQFIKDTGMVSFPPRKDGGTVKGWTPFDIEFHRRITSISGTTISVDAPIVQGIEDRWGGALVQRFDDQRPEHIGIESLLIKSDFSSETDEDHANIGVAINNCVNCWARQLVVKHVVWAGVTADKNSLQTQVEDCEVSELKSQITGGRRYNFNIDGQLALFQRLKAYDGRHNFVFGAKVAGPNVFLDGVVKNEHSSSEPHHRWSVGGLYDRIRASVYFQDRQNFGTGHGWSGANYVAWNTEGEICCQIPPGATQYSIGHSGKKFEGSFAKGKQQCDFDSFGQHVTPSSLYLAQLQERTAKSPRDAINPPAPPTPRPLSPTTRKPTKRPTQQPTKQPTAAARQCSTGIANGNVCCSSSCGACGGTGCGTRVGGSDSCCLTPIKTANKLCTANAPPCVITDTLVRDTQCLNNLAANSVCCPKACGSCGGSGCATRPGGATSCCSKPILESQISCGSADPPCIIPFAAQFAAEVNDRSTNIGYTLQNQGFYVSAQNLFPTGQGVHLWKSLGPGIMQIFGESTCSQVKLLEFNLCLQVVSGVLKNGAEVELLECDCQNPDQGFVLEGELYKVKSNPTFCLSSPFPQQGSAVQLWECTNNNTTRFTKQPLPEVPQFAAFEEGGVGPADVDFLWGNLPEKESYPPMMVSDQTKVKFKYDETSRVYRLNKEQYDTCNFSDAQTGEAVVGLEEEDSVGPPVPALKVTSFPSSKIDVGSASQSSIDPGTPAADVAEIRALGVTTHEEEGFLESTFEMGFGETAYFASLQCKAGVKLMVKARNSAINQVASFEVSAACQEAASSCGECVGRGCTWCSGVCQSNLLCSNNQMGAISDDGCNPPPSITVSSSQLSVVTTSVWLFCGTVALAYAHLAAWY